MLKEQNLIKLATQLNMELNKVLEKNPELIQSGTCDVQLIEFRANMLEYFSNLLTVLSEYNIRLASLIDTVRKSQTKDLIVIEDKIKSTDNVESKHVPHKTSVPINIIGGINIPAIKIVSTNQIKLSGELYYIESNDIFAIKICGRIYYGNIGNIYDSNPKKIKECNNRNNHNFTQCNYYHPFSKYPASKDIKNYVSSSWIYASCDERSKTCYRRIGSRKNIEFDIQNMTISNVSEFESQLMHDILCGLAIHYNKIT